MTCSHDPVPVELATGEVVGWLCSRCLADVPHPCCCDDPHMLEEWTFGSYQSHQWCGRCGGGLPGTTLAY